MYNLRTYRYTPVSHGEPPSHGATVYGEMQYTQILIPAAGVSCNNCKYELRISLIILGHFYDKKCLEPLIYKGLSQTTYN